MTMEWNERYALYALAHGSTPERMIGDDDARWTGGKMAGFILWMHEMREQFRSSAADNFDAWLRARAQPEGP